jgi:hypothetical protein
MSLNENDYSPQLFVDGINRIIGAKDLSLQKLQVEDITASDNQFIKARREDNQPTAFHDINIANSFIKEQGYALLNVTLYSPSVVRYASDTLFTIMSWQEIETLNLAHGFDGTRLAGREAKSVKDVYELLKVYDRDNNLSLLDDGETIEFVTNQGTKYCVYGGDYVMYPHGGHWHPDYEYLDIYQELLECMIYCEYATYIKDLPPWYPEWMLRD